MKTAISVSELETLIEFDTPVAIFDVRKRPAFDADSAMILGADYRDPAETAAWAAEAPKDRLVVCYCVHGHEVSQAAQRELSRQGIRACYLRGGMDAWKEASGALIAKSP